MFLDFLYNINLTKDQKYLSNELDRFLFNSLDFLIIQGSAGTGKTFLVSKYAKYLYKKNIDFVILAPTGRASKILYEKSHFRTKTIHSEIYSFFEKKINLEKDEIKIFFKLKENYRNNTIFIIDESSMISDTFSSDENLIFGSGKLLSDLIMYIKSGNNNKIIFLGDEYQLPPVRAKDSPALNREYLEKFFNLMGDKITLNDIVRQKEDSYILKNANIIKRHIDNKNFFELKFKYNLDFIKDKNFIENYDYSNPGKDIIICSTNEKSLEYNQKVRRKMNYKYNIEIGDILLNTKNVYFDNKPIFNGEFFKVIDILNHEKKDSFVGKGEHVILEFYDLVLKDTYFNEEITVKIFANSLFSRSTDIDINLKKALYSMCINEIYQKKGLSTEFILQQIDNNPYFNALHVKYGYAITAHKAQGGEWNKVFIDPDYYNAFKTKEYFQWLYTAITRAKERVYIKEVPFKVFSYNKLKLQFDFTIKREINISYNLRFSNSILKDLYLAIRDKISEKKFEIIGIDHFQYQEVYYIKRGKDYLKVQLYYNKNYEPTRLKVIETTKKELAQEFLDIFNSKETMNNKSIIDKTIKKNDCINIYIDGSYDHSLKKIGSGFVVMKGNVLEKYWKGFSEEKFLKHRNVAGEIFAAILAFEYAKQENLKCIEINYDYEGIEKWALGLWKTNTELTRYYKQQYDYYSSLFLIKFNKIKSHSGNKFNDIADELAKKAVYESNYNIKYDIEVKI
ncbi:RNase H [Marinitoga hydrogenitolerans DSM 16785]|uniref:RNase H n=1 Tax=Marinitoga hydrogenitolerans (strain DSM 16785 / JCM 12826 / AT1271) TaxID=1122195 RepID=A0A1M4YUN6_MARH1|nr:AAA family ATPase [Marinitoga hydrogenitolerans]SHF09428.1 RNase H [Marinitoga hydrogenitolerans DSM 16785]